jgi:hypothetical protein
MQWPSFGAAAAPAPPSFPSFGAPAAAPSLFSTPGFGVAPPAPAFGAAPPPAAPAFGAASSMSSSVFGGFGGAGGFGASSAPAGGRGSRIARYAPTQDPDPESVTKGLMFECIIAAPAYMQSGKTLEELRWEDKQDGNYSSGGGGAGVMGGSAFGAAAAPTMSFSAAPSQTNAFGSVSAPSFGAAAPSFSLGGPVANSGVFGNAFGANTSSAFGAAPKQPAFSLPAATGNAFGAAKPATVGFGATAFSAPQPSFSAGFGQTSAFTTAAPQQQQPATNSFFSSPQPAAAATGLGTSLGGGFSFGATPFAAQTTSAFAMPTSFQTSFTLPQQAAPVAPAPPAETKVICRTVGDNICAPWDNEQSAADVASQGVNPSSTAASSASIYTYASPSRGFASDTPSDYYSPPPDYVKPVARSRVGLGLGRGGSATWAARAASDRAAASASSRQSAASVEHHGSAPDEAPAEMPPGPGSVTRRSMRGGMAVSAELRLALETPLAHERSEPVSRRVSPSGRVVAYRFVPRISELVPRAAVPDLDGTGDECVIITVRFAPDIEAARLSWAQSPGPFTPSEKLALAALNAICEVFVVVDVNIDGAVELRARALIRRREAAASLLAELRDMSVSAGARAPSDAAAPFDAAAAVLKSMSPLAQDFRINNGRSPSDGLAPVDMHVRLDFDLDPLFTGYEGDSDSRAPSHALTLAAAGVGRDALVSVAFERPQVVPVASVSTAQHGMGEAAARTQMQLAAADWAQYQAERSLRAELPSLPSPVDDYETLPGPRELASLSSFALARIDHFTVSRRGHGSITWHDAIDLRGLDIARAVLIGPADGSDDPGVEVYPEAIWSHDEKPPLGSGLNAPARVTLCAVWPEDESGNSDDAHVGFLRGVCAGNGSVFVSWDATSGDFTFDVAHFSGYRVPKRASAAAPAVGRHLQQSAAPSTPAATLPPQGSAATDASIMATVAGSALRADDLSLPSPAIIAKGFQKIESEIKNAGTRSTAGITSSLLRSSRRRDSASHALSWGGAVEATTSTIGSVPSAPPALPTQPYTSSRDSSRAAFDALFRIPPGEDSDVSPAAITFSDSVHSYPPSQRLLASWTEAAAAAGSMRAATSLVATPLPPAPLAPLPKSRAYNSSARAAAASQSSFTAKFGARDDLILHSGLPLGIHYS